MLSFRDRLLAPLGRAMLEAGGGGELHGNATGSGAPRVNLGGVVAGQVLKKNNLGDERIGAGLIDLGGCEWDGCGDCKDLFRFARLHLQTTKIWYVSSMISYSHSYRHF